jgi:hypothetical protein
VEDADLPVPADRHIAHEQLERRVHRAVADRLSEAIGDARIALVDAFCGEAAFDLDANGEPLIAANAEKAIDNALAPLCALQDEFTRRSGGA